MAFGQAQLSSDGCCERLRAVAAPIFAAISTETATGQLLVVHVASVPRRGEVKAHILAALSDAPDCKIKIRFHNERELLAPVPDGMRTGAFRPARLYRRR